MKHEFEDHIVGIAVVLVLVFAVIMYHHSQTLKAAYVTNSENTEYASNRSTNMMDNGSVSNAVNTNTNDNTTTSVAGVVSGRTNSKTSNVPTTNAVNP